MNKDHFNISYWYFVFVPLLCGLSWLEFVKIILIASRRLPLASFLKLTVCVWVMGDEEPFPLFECLDFQL